MHDLYSGNFEVNTSAGNPTGTVVAPMQNDRGDTAHKFPSQTTINLQATPTLTSEIDAPCKKTSHGPQQLVRVTTTDEEKESTPHILVLRDANINMSTCPRTVALALKLPLIAWHTPLQILTDTGLKEQSNHFVCLHDIFGDKTAILDGPIHTHITLSIRAANHMGYRITFQPIREEVQIHNARNELLACTEQQKHKRPTMFYLDERAFSSRQSTTNNQQNQESPYQERRPSHNL